MSFKQEVENAKIAGGIGMQQNGFGNIVKRRINNGSSSLPLYAHHNAMEPSSSENIYVRGNGYISKTLPSMSSDEKDNLNDKNKYD